MKNKIIILILVVITTISLSNITLMSVDAAIEKNAVNYKCADYEKDYSLLNLKDEFNYSFKGQVVSYIGTSQYNGNGTNIPYTYFSVEVLEVEKGEMDSEIIIKFYGGYDNDNVLTLI